jgi:hypothetical protein
MGCLDSLAGLTPSAAKPAGTEFPFKKGDKVRVVRTAVSKTQGWNNAWVTEMNDAVGKTGTVTSIFPTDLDVSVEIPGIENHYGYPSFVLELVNDQIQTTPAPVASTKTLLGGFVVGQRVTTRSGNRATVTHADETFVYVNQDNGMQTGWYPRNLTLITPAPAVTTPAPAVTKPVALSRSQVLKAARTLAVKLARQNPAKTVTADWVQEELQELGYKSTDLGNAAGAIFKSNQFKNTGLTAKSVRPGSNQRRITVWQYVGDAVPEVYQYAGTPTAPTVTPGQFIVERKWSDGVWGRSGNRTADGHSLSTFVFSTREAAQKEADRQISRQYGDYRVASLPMATPAPVRYVVEVKHDAIWNRSKNVPEVFSSLEEAEKTANQQRLKNGLSYRAVPQS